MLTLIDDPLFARTEQIGFGIRGVIAYDPGTGAEMHCSYGRRQSGRPTRYTISLPTGEYEEWANEYGTFRRAVCSKAFGFTAHSHEEAVAKALLKMGPTNAKV